MKRFFFIVLLFFVTVSSSFAQKFGHVNFGNLLNEMPATAAAEKQLEAFNKEQTAKGDAMVTKLKADVAAAEAKAPNLPPVDLRALQTKLKKDEQAIRQFEQQMAINVEKKRRELLGPIIKQAKDAIKAVGKTKGYTFIFDSSLFNALLFTQDGTDVMPQVKAQLGIK